MNESEALLAIQEQLDGIERAPDTLNEIASIMVKAGYRLSIADRTVKDLRDAGYLVVLFSPDELVGVPFHDYGPLSDRLIETGFEEIERSIEIQQSG